MIPRFDHATVVDVVADLTGRHLDTDPRTDPGTDPPPGGRALLRLDGPTVAVLSEHHDGRDTRLVEVDRVYPDRQGRYALGAYLWTWRVEGQPARCRTQGCPNDPDDGQGRDGLCGTCAERRDRTRVAGQDGGHRPAVPAGRRLRVPHPPGTPRDPSGHNNQVRAHGRCLCPCHGGR